MPSKASVKTRDEIGNLAADFNALIRARRRTESALKQSEQRLRTITDNVPTMIVYAGADQRDQFANKVYLEWFAHGHGDIVGHTVHDILGEDAYQMVRPYIEAVLRGESIQYERHVTREHNDYSLQVNYVPEWDEHHHLVGFYVLMHDITASKQYEAKLESLALSDALTGLPNRRLLQDRIRQAITYTQRTDHTMALLFLDLDGFKKVNDTLGHDIGDVLLRQVARRLVGSVRAADTVARLGGDEFVVCLSRLTTPDDARIVAEKIIRTIAFPYAIESDEIQVTVSVGIGMYPQHSDNEETLMKAADSALYEAKHAGKNIYRFASNLLGAVDDDHHPAVQIHSATSTPVSET